MAVTPPSIQELRDRIKGFLETALGITIPGFGKNFLNAWIGTQAASSKLFYLSLAKVQKNIFVDTADPEALGGTLERFGRVKLGRNPFPATAGFYTIQVTGTIGAIITASTTFKSDDDSSNPGNLYILDNDFTLTATTDFIQVRALTLGSDGRLVLVDGLTSTSPLLNVDSNAVVTAEDVIPLNAETVEEYREKALLAYRLEPQGGASSDYILWAGDAQGVRRSYPYARSGESATIDLFVEATVIDSTDGKGTPSQAILDEVEQVVEFDPDITLPLPERGRRPLGAFEIAFLPILLRVVDIEITGFVGLTPEIETTVFTALETFLFDVRPFIAGADVLENKNDIINVNSLTNVVVSAIPPNTFFNTLLLKIDGVPTTSFQLENGDIPTLNTVIYI